MSEKRFRIVHLNLKRLDMCDIQDTAQETPTFYNDLGHISSVEPVCELLNDLSDKIDEQQATINLLLDLLYQSEATVISEYSNHIGEDMDKLDKIFKEKDIKEIGRFIRGCDDE